MIKFKTASIEKKYRRVGTLSIVAVLFLILVGGIVRSTGSGMGCPDWPTCFGLLVPPTSVEEIPAQFFVDHPEYSSQEFNVYQTWTEYINRLVGALIGLFVLATAALSLVYFKKDRRIPLLSIAVVLLTGFQAWLGKVVVDKNLEGQYVTFHMLLAMVILAMLIVAVHLSKTWTRDKAPSFSIPGWVNWLGAGVVLVTLVQTLIGTQVREEVDMIAESLSFQARETYVDLLGTSFSIHKVFWFVVVAGMIVWVRTLFKHMGDNRVVKLLSAAMMIGVALEVLFGILLANFALPPVLQPAHLLIGSLIFAAQFALFIYVVRIERMGAPSDLALSGIQRNTVA